MVQEEAQAAEKTLKTAQERLNNMKIEAPIPEPQQVPISERFRRFVNNNGLAGTINGKQYLKAEAWQYLAHIFHLCPVTDCVAMINLEEKDVHKNFLGVKCVCTLRNREGQVVGAGTMTALCSEPFLKDKDEYAVYGMAQTRAISRAIRNTYGWVARGAGFESTPWDEMPK